MRGGVVRRGVREESETIKEEDTGRREGEGGWSDWEMKEWEGEERGEWGNKFRMEWGRQRRGERRIMRPAGKKKRILQSNASYWWAITPLWTQPIRGRAAASPVTSRFWSSRVQRPSAQRGASSSCSSCHHGWAVLPLTLGEFCFWTVPKEGYNGIWNEWNVSCYLTDYMGSY